MDCDKERQFWIQNERVILKAAAVFACDLLRISIAAA
jgi:hypothetical protein